MNEFLAFEFERHPEFFGERNQDAREYRPGHPTQALIEAVCSEGDVLKEQVGELKAAFLAGYFYGHTSECFGCERAFNLENAKYV